MFKENTDFGHSVFSYVLKAKKGIDSLEASYEENTITLYLDDKKQSGWDISDKVGFSGTMDLPNGKQLSLVLSGRWITLKRRAIQRKKQHKPILGKWKFINWGIYIFMMVSMYVQLVGRYHTSITGIVVISCGWILVLLLTYYVFVYHLNKVVNTGQNKI